VGSSVMRMTSSVFFATCLAVISALDASCSSMVVVVVDRREGQQQHDIAFVGWLMLLERCDSTVMTTPNANAQRHMACMHGERA